MKSLLTFALAPFASVLITMADLDAPIRANDNDAAIARLREAILLIPASAPPTRRPGPCPHTFNSLDPL